MEHIAFQKTEGDINLGKDRLKWTSKVQDEETNRILEEDARYFLHQAMSTPCLDVLESCNGASFHNLEGKEYLDFHGNNVHQLGYKNEFVVNKIIEQLHTLPFSPRRYTNKPAVDFAKKLTSLLPEGLNRVLFAPGGTSVIGMALKLARVVTGKHKVISLWDSFHGASLDAIAVGGEAVFRKGMGPMTSGVERIPAPTSYRGIFTQEDDSDIKYGEYLEYVIEKEGDIGAFIIETIRNTDVQIPSKAYWKKIQEICKKHQVLLILDEIPIALGRTGKMFAFEHYDIEPDILCIGKGLGAGIMPFSAMVTKDEYNIAKDISLGHYTHEKSPLGAIAAHASLEFIENENLLEKVKSDEAYMNTRLNQMKDKYEIIGDIRGLGLLWGVELVKDRKTKEPASEFAERVMYHCLEHGLSFKVSQTNVLQLSPALIIERNDLVRALDILEESIAIEFS